MMKLLLKKQNNFLFTLIAGVLLTGILIVLPTDYEDAVLYRDAERAVCEVREVDNSAVITSGLIQSGEQTCVLEVKNGIFKGKTIDGVNFLSGSLEKDKMYEAGDKALVTISHSGNEIKSAVMSDHFRLDKELLLLVLFVILLIAVAGKNGIQAIFSFIITVLLIWKVLVPCYLKGYSPVWTGIAIVVTLTLIIIFFVYGWDKRTVVATAGSLLGILTTCLLGILFTDLFKLHGAIMSNAESLLYSGYQNLDLTAIFMSSIFIGASGAMMDLSVDITSAVAEVLHTLVGSFGLVTVGPFTALMAALLLTKNPFFISRKRKIHRLINLFSIKKV